MRALLTVVAVLIAVAAYADWPDLTTESGTWPESESGAAPVPIPANIVWGPYDFEAQDSACSTLDNTQGPRGTVDCACNTPPCPLSGLQSVEMNFDNMGVGNLEWRSRPWTLGGAGNHVAVFDGLLNFDSVITAGTAASLATLQDGSSPRGTIFTTFDQGPASGPGVACRTVGGTFGTWTTPGTGSRKFRVAWGWTAQDCTDLGLTDSGADGDCCGIWSDTTGDWGDTFISEGDGSDALSRTSNGVFLGYNVAATPGLPINIWDDLAICDEIPPPGGKCGDLPPP